HPAAEELVRPARDVADREHAVRARVEARVAHDAVGEVEAGAVEPLNVWDDADSDDDGVGLEHGAVAEPQAVRALTVRRRHVNAETQLRPVLAVEVHEERTHLRPERACERRLLELDDGDVAAAGARARGALRPDE